MIYSIGDKFLVNGIETEVKYINRDMAWVASSDEMIHVVMARLDNQGYAQEGIKAIPINKSECQAV